MSGDAALSLLREGLILVATIAAPILLLSMAVGMLIAVFQAATQISEQTLTFVPKLILVFIVLIAAGSWMMTSLVDFAQNVFSMMLY